MTKLVLILRHHKNHILNMTKECNIKYSLMCLPICTNKTCTVDRKHNVRVMAANIVNNLVIGPLHKCRINRKYGFHSLHCQRSAHRSCMLLGNAYIDHPLWELLCKFSEPRSCWHGRSYSNNPFVLFRKLNQGMREYFSIHRISDCLQHLTRFNFIRCNSVPFV
ncbi:hypothetical protein D1872_248740 [compost metagenome]